MSMPTATAVVAPPTILSCKLCTIHLERLCYERAWWFRIVRESFAVGIRLFALVCRLRHVDGAARSKMCHHCLRFRKNALKERSKLFAWLDSYLNPVFNRLRDSLLTPAELEHARDLARRAGDPAFEVAP